MQLIINLLKWSHLKLWAANPDGHFLSGVDDCFPMTKDLETIFEKGWLHWNKILKVSQSYRSFKKLPINVVWKVREDELMWIWHEVVFIQFIANVLHCHLSK